MKRLLLLSLVFHFTNIRAQTTPPNSYSNAYDEIQKRMATYIGKPYQAINGSIDGVEFSNETLRGKTVFINFWFEACAPCIAEFEGLEKMYEKLKDSSNIVIIGITFETPEVIKAVKEKYKLKFGIASLPRQECYRLNFNNGFPTSVILDPKGIIKYIHSGGTTNVDVATEFIMTEIYPKMTGGL